MRSLRCRTLLLAGVTMAVVAAGAQPAAAHPFGPPLTASLAASGSTVTVTWAAAEDDWLNLGEHVGAFEQSPADASAAALTGAEKLERSEPLRRYLLDTIRVRQEQQPCSGAVEDLTDVLTDGVELHFTCPDVVSDVDVTVSALSDINPAYRTVVTAPSGTRPGKTLLNAGTPTQLFSFAPPGAEVAGGFPPVLGALLLCLGLSASALTVVAARRARRPRSTR